MARSYQKSSAAPKVLIFLALLGGIGYAFKDDIIKNIPETKPTPPKTSPRVEPEKDVTPTPPPTKADKAVTVKTPDPVVEKPIEKSNFVPPPNFRSVAKTLHEEGVAAVHSLDFKKAKELFIKEAEMLTTDRAASKKAMKLAGRVDTYLQLLDGVEFNPEAANDMVTIRRYDGPDIEEVAITRTTSTHYIIRKRSGISMPIKKSMVEKIVKITPEERKLRLEKNFDQKVKAKNPSTAGDYFELAKHAYQDKLSKQALKYLTLAEKKGGKNILKVVREEGASRLLKHAYWCESTNRTIVAKVWCNKVIKDYKDLPDKVKEARELISKINTPKAATYKPTVHFKEKKPEKPKTPKKPTKVDVTPEPEEEDIEVEVDKISGGGANAALIKEINTKFEKAMGYFMKGRPGSPGSNKNLKLAAALFDEVAALCRKALKREPKNTAIQSRQTDAVRHAYHSRKMQTL